MIRELSFVTATAVLITACTSISASSNTHLASARIASDGSSPAGTAEVFAQGNEASLVITLTGMPAGLHGVHLHEVGTCDLPSFKSAGGHLNPLARQHGMDNPMGHHLGDLPNIEVGEDGVGELTIAIDLAPEALIEALFDADGTAIVVHAGPDDYKTDPSGNSGPRIACGVFKRG